MTQKIDKFLIKYVFQDHIIHFKASLEMKKVFILITKTKGGGRYRICIRTFCYNYKLLWKKDLICPFCRYEIGWLNDIHINTQTFLAMTNPTLPGLLFLLYDPWQITTTIQSSLCTSLTPHYVVFVVVVQ